MEYKWMCTLDVGNNTCPYYSADSDSCIACETAEPKAEYKREPRWYEQYYRN